MWRRIALASGGILLVALIAAPFLDPTCILWGWLRGEPFFKGRPLTYWKKEMKEDGKSGYLRAKMIDTFTADSDAARPMLLDAIKDPDKDIRWVAAALFGKSGPRAAPAVPQLVQTLEDGDPEVRFAAAQALGSIGPDAAVAFPSLRPLLDDEDKKVVFAAEDALWGIDPERAAASLGWQHWVFADMGFAVTMPATAEWKTEVRQIEGHSLACHSFSAADKEVLFLASVVDYPKGVLQTATDEQRFAGLRGLAGAAMGGRLVSDGEIVRDGRRGLEQVIEVEGKGSLRARSWWVGDRLYVSQVASDSKMLLNTKRVTRFLDSFDLMPHSNALP